MWGIKTEFTKSPLINAKSESLFTSGFWKRYRNNRCLIPANGFFEWKMLAGKRSPFYFKVKNRPLFYMAGIFTEREESAGYHFYSFAILELSTRPRPILEPITTVDAFLRSGSSQVFPEVREG